MRLRSWLSLLLIGLFIVCPVAVPATELQRSGFWGSLEAGIGSVRSQLPQSDGEHERLYLGFTGGYSLNPHLLLGVELSGWNIQSGNLHDPSQGEGIMQLLGIARLYPSEQGGYFLKIGGGYLDHWNNRPNETRRQEGWELCLGGGYDIALTTRFAMTPFINFSFGKAGNEDNRIITFGVGMTIQ